MTIRTLFSIGDKVKIRVYHADDPGEKFRNLTGTIERISITRSDNKFQKRYSIVYDYQGTIRYVDLWEMDLYHMQEDRGGQNG